MKKIGKFQRYTGVGARKEEVTVAVEGGIATCSNPCPFIDLSTSARVNCGGTVLCTGVNLLAEAGPSFQPVNEQNFPKCGYPTRESVVIFRSSQQN